MITLNNIINKYSVDDIINILLLKFYIDSDYIYKIESEEIEKIENSLSKFSIFEINFLYKLFYYDIELSFYFLNKNLFYKLLLVKVNLNKKELEIYKKILLIFVNKIKKFNINQYFNKNTIFNSEIGFVI